MTRRTLWTGLAVIALLIFAAAHYAQADVITCTTACDGRKPKSALLPADIVQWCESGGGLSQGAPLAICPNIVRLRVDNLQSYSWTLTDTGWYRFVDVPTAPVVVPYKQFIPPMYPKPFGNGSAYKIDTVNPRGGNVFANPSVLAYYYHDGTKWQCFGYASDPSKWASDKIDLLQSSVFALFLGDKAPADAALKANLARRLTLEEATVRDALCATIPVPPPIVVPPPVPVVEYVVSFWITGQRPVYPVVAGVRKTSNIGHIETDKPCDCVKLKDGSYCSVEGQPKTTTGVFPANSVAVCAKK